jgi:hypothetical protein
MWDTSSEAVLWVLFFAMGVYFIPKYLGAKRNIGIFWSAIFTIILTPIGGLFMAMISRTKPNPPRHKTNLVFGFICVISLGLVLTKSRDTTFFAQLLQNIALIIYCFSLSTKPLNDNLDTDSSLPNQQI